jgi:hypothetical protein
MSSALRRLRHALLLVPVLVTPGCCTLARLFCGPDRSAWVSVGFDTEQAAVRTLLEAIRRDNSDIIVLCMSPRLRKAEAIDTLKGHLAWERLKSEHSGLHLAGYGRITAIEPTGPGQATATVDVEGRILRLRLVRQSFWSARYLGRDGLPMEDGQNGIDLAAAVVTQTAPDDRRTTVSPAPLAIEHPSIPQLDAGRLIRLEWGNEWKIDSFEMVADDGQ